MSKGHATSPQTSPPAVAWLSEPSILAFVLLERISEAIRGWVVRRPAVAPEPAAVQIQSAPQAT